jgi:perosamine synthetase
MHKQLAIFIRGIYGKPDGFIPMHEPRFIGNEKQYLENCIDSTYVSSVGEYVDKVGELIAKITGAAYVIPITNGTSALHLALIGADVSSGDEVLTQSLTFIATCNAISYQGALPHFVDVDEDTLGMSPSKLRKHLEEIAVIENGVCRNKLTGNVIRACVPMHTFGLPLRIDEIAQICEEYHIILIEDAAESMGSYYQGKHTGTFGKLGVFSFNGNKIVTAGGGGAIITDDVELGKHLLHLSTQAKIPHAYNYEHDFVGYNYRLPNINAAILSAQLENLDAFVDDKREIHESYKQFFADFDGITLIQELANAKSNFWLNAIQLESEKQKIEFIEFMDNAGIMSRPIWKLIHTLPMYLNCPKGGLETSEKIVKTVVNITSSSRLA